MSSDTISVAHVALNTSEPTSFHFADLPAWIIWQFPRRNGAHMIGAVHPPLANHGWYPAAIDHDGGTLQIYAHVGQPAPTPEKAMQFFISDAADNAPI